ncbi:hypothetical protein DL96DRAFT_534119 [Flagelloscypha sp. PMI_526]|nr:hypothetical protein DL96DRAFT_534119 [Flagelloscypha sp. PMI_526]
MSLHLCRLLLLLLVLCLSCVYYHPSITRSAVYSSPLRSALLVTLIRDSSDISTYPKTIGFSSLFLNYASFLSSPFLFLTPRHESLLLTTSSFLYFSLSFPSNLSPRFWKW